MTVLPDLADVLAEVNHFRAQDLGVAPLDAMPKGKRSNACQCPLAHALEADSVWPSTDRERGWIAYEPFLLTGGLPEDKRRPLPPLLNDFGLQFDLGRYPELIDA